MSALARLREAADVFEDYLDAKIDSSEPVKKAFNLTHGDARALLALVEACGRLDAALMDQPDVSNDTERMMWTLEYWNTMRALRAALQRVRGE